MIQQVKAPASKLDDLILIPKSHGRRTESTSPKLSSDYQSNK